MTVLAFKPKVKGTQPKMDTRPRFYCTACNHAEFTILEDRRLYCLGCGRRIGNLRVIDDAAKA